MISADVYSEIYELLSYMNKSVVMKIPVEILEGIKRNRNIKYISKIDKNDMFNRKNLLPETIEFIAWIDVNFWISDNERIKLQNEYKKYFMIEEQNKIEKYYKENNKMFKNNNVSQGIDMNIIDTESKLENNSKNIELIKYKKSIFSIIIDKIRLFLNIKK